MAVQTKRQPAAAETITVKYVGQQEELLYSSWEVPKELVFPQRGKQPKLTPAAWIEREAAKLSEQKAAAEAERIAAAEQETARQQAQQAAEAEARKAEKAAAEKQRRAELRAEMKGDIDQQTAAVMQAAAAWQSKGEVFEQDYQQKRESFHEEGNQLLAEIRQIRDEAVHVLSQLQQAEGKNSLAIFEISKRLQALEAKQNQ